MNNSYVLIWIENKFARFAEREREKERESFIDTCERSALTAANKENQRESEKKKKIMCTVHAIKYSYRTYTCRYHM